MIGMVRKPNKFKNFKIDLLIFFISLYVDLSIGVRIEHDFNNISLVKANNGRKPAILATQIALHFSV